ncbi:MAG: hypothetical protein WBM53_06075, partial [Maribacter sp.]
VKIDPLRGSFVIASKIEILSKSAEVMFGGVETQGNSGNKIPNFFCSFRPEAFKIGDLFNSLRGTMLDQLDLNGGLWSIAGTNASIDLLQLPKEAAVFFGSDDIKIKSGLNLHKNLELPGQIEGLKTLFSRLDIGAIQAPLSGIMNISLDALLNNKGLPDSNPFSLSVPLPKTLPNAFPNWLSSASRTLQFEYGKALNVTFRDSLEANLNNTKKVFITQMGITTSPDSKNAIMRSELQEAWANPFGQSWLNLRNVAIELGMAEGDKSNAILSGIFEIGQKECKANIELIKDNSNWGARFIGSVDALAVRDVLQFAKKRGLAVPNDLGGDNLELNDVTVMFETMDENSFAVSAGTKVFGVNGNFLLSVEKNKNDAAQLLFGVRVEKFGLKDLNPAIGNTAFGKLTMPAVAFTIARSLASGQEKGNTGGSNGGGETKGIGSISIPSANLSLPALKFFRPAFNKSSGDDVSDNTKGGESNSGDGTGNESFQLNLKPGLNLGGRLPLSGIGEKLLSVMGITDPNLGIILEGKLGMSGGSLFNGNFSDAIDWNIRAVLPPQERTKLPDWLHFDPSSQRALEIAMDPDLRISILNQLTADLDDQQRIFIFSVNLAKNDSGAEVVLKGKLEGAWRQPYGIKWLDLNEVELELTLGSESMGAAMSSSFVLGNRTLGVGIALMGSEKDRTITFTTTADQLSSKEFITIVKEHLEIENLFEHMPPSELLTLKNPTITAVMGTQRSFSISAETTVMNRRADMQFFAKKESGKEAQFLLGFQADGFSLSDAIPGLDNPIVQSLKIPQITLVIAKSDRSIKSEEMPSDARMFYGSIYGTESFNLNIEPGLNMIGPMPLGSVSDESPIKAIMKLLSPDADVSQLVLEGTLPGKVLGLGGEGGMSGLSIRANLPPMSPKGAPEWFVSGQLAFQITGKPSVGLVGELTVDVDGDILTFFTETSIAVVPAGVELGVLGGLMAAAPWVGPVGIDWVTFNQVRLKLALNPFSVKLGFMADMKFGDKDIAVAAVLPLNIYTGIPTGLGISGESEEGVALSDIVAIQHAMNTAAGRTRPALKIDNLPEVAIRGLLFRFSTMNEPDLDLKLGTAFSGELWIAKGGSKNPEKFAEILLDVGLDGIKGRSALGNFEMGLIEWKDAELDLAITVPDQHFLISGGLDIGIAAGEGTLSLARNNTFLDANVMISKFECELTGATQMEVLRPAMQLEGKMKNDFNGAIAREVATVLHEFAANIDELLAPVRESADRAKESLVTREEALEIVRKGIVATQDKTRGAAIEADKRQQQLGAEMNAAEQRSNNAHDVWSNTPKRQVKVKATRLADKVKKASEFREARREYVAASAASTSANASVKALRPIESYPKIQKAMLDLAGAKKELEKKRAELSTAKAKLQKRAQDMRAKGDNLVVINKAGFTADLGGMKKNSTANMTLDIKYMEKPETIQLDWQFGNMRANARKCAQLIVGSFWK